MSLDLISHLFGISDSVLIVRMAKKVNSLEALWKRKFEKRIEELTNDILKEAQRTGRLNTKNVEFDDLVIKHKLDVVQTAIKHAKQAPEKSNLRAPDKLAKPDKMSMLERIRRQYDKWKKTGELPKRERGISDNIKKEYLKRIQSAYKKYGEDFRSGKTYDQEEARIKIQEAANVSYSRAKTIINTETTRYYNKARADYYEDAEGVTHYLFMAIRDSRTTKWCSTRHRLVYRKDGRFIEKETPPCHWNCRSEILPLSPSNPRHKRYIQDETMQRSNNSPEPLPEGWNR